MAFSNHQFHMPGSYHFEGPGASNTALNADMYRPPASPSSSTYNLAKSTGSLLSDNSYAASNVPAAPRLGSRKRTFEESTARSHDFGRDSRIEDSAHGHHRYTLAGQIETPGAQVPPRDGVLEDSLYSDVDYRRALGSTREDATPAAGRTSLVNAETGAPVTPSTAGWTTFAFQAIGGVVGKVWEFCRGGAGAFRGFQAGGGKGYEFNGQPIPTLVPARPSHSPHLGDPDRTPHSPPGAWNDHAPCPPPPPPPMEKDPELDTAPEQPAAKRRQTGLAYENEELRRNWVMVEDDDPATDTPTKPPPSRAASTASSRIPAAGRPRMPSLLQQPRISTLGRKINIPSPRFGAERPSHIPARASSSRLSMASAASYAGQQHARSSSFHNHREPASFASPRSPVEPPLDANSPSPYNNNNNNNTSRIPQPKGFGPNPFAAIRTASPNQPRTSPSRPSSRQSLHPSPLAAPPGTSRIATPSSGHRKSASTTSVGGSSARGRHSLGLSTENRATPCPKPQTSPRLDDEGRHLATRRYAAEKRADSRLDRLNAELQGLIRQGQEALGTTYDVDMDEGWEEA